MLFDIVSFDVDVGRRIHNYFVYIDEKCPQVFHSHVLGSK